MKSLLHLFVVAYCLGAGLTAAGYESQKTAIPLMVFEERYAINYPAQVLEAGADYAYGGGTGNVYFINYPFDDGVTHLVRVPQSHNGEELTRRDDQRVRIVKTFPLTFTHGSVLFDPRKEYPVLEENGERLLVEVPGTQKPIQVDADRFKLKRKFVFQGKPAEEVSEAIVSNSEISAYLESHPPLDNLQVIENEVEGICLIETPDASGTGFLFGMEGRVYCITNHHVLGAGNDLKMVTADDRQFTPVYYEVAADRDLARILLKETPASFQTYGEAKLQETIKILGNSGGEGVVTFEEGKVIGFAPKVIEVDSDFIAGNSGSPVLNEAHEVIGVATYVVTADEGEDDWVAEKTRFVKARRFATRFTSDVEWIAVDTKSLGRGHKTFEAHLVYIDEMINLMWTFGHTPGSQIVESAWTNSTLRGWVRQTNLMNKKFLSQEQAFRYYTQLEYDDGIRKFTTDRLAGYELQIRRLNHLTKRQLTQLQQDGRSLPSLGYFPERVKELETQYKILIDGLDYASRYVAENISK